MMPFDHRLTVTLPVFPCEAKGMKMPSHFFNAARMLGLVAIWRKCGDTISSSPSKTRTILTGSLLPAARIAWSAEGQLPVCPYWVHPPRTQAGKGVGRDRWGQ